MSKIRIKNFGPIKEGFDTEDGFMDIKKVTVFIGDQGTGKSTVAKLISTLMWIEKAANRGEFGNTYHIEGGMGHFARYQLIENYFRSNSEIDYYGEEYNLICKGRGSISIIKKNTQKYVVPQLMYTSAERNFLSTIENLYDVKNLPGHLFDFAEALRKAQNELKGAKINLPIKGYEYEFDLNTRQSIIYGKDYQVNLFEASSGLQSLVPLYIASRNLALAVRNGEDDYRSNVSVNQIIRRNEEISKTMLDKTLSDDEKRIKLLEISARFINKCFINIVEEPEQNLFPISQRAILNSLVGFANMNDGNKLIMTTHSPYIISYLGIAVQGHNLLEKINAAGNPEGFKERMEQVVPKRSVIAPEDLVIYQLQENGTISRLPDYEGIPADKNYLNQSLLESSQLFDTLLEIEEDL